MSSPCAVAWPYANGPRHIGHVSGIGVPSDVSSASPICEGLHGLGVTYDLYTRTTTGNHAHVVQELFGAMYRNGYIIPRTSRGAISPSTGRTLPDRYVEGTCPICGYGAARGDQCDNCGNQLDAAELIDPRSRINGERPEFVETEHLFLDLPAFTGSLGSWLATLTMSGSKFSTSRGTVIYLHDFGPDALRYFIFIAAAGPETQDVDFTWDEFVRRINFELADEWGNLVNRAASMAHKNNGAVPAPTTPAPADAELLALSRAAFDTVGAHLARSRFRAGIAEAMRVVTAANRYLSDQEPWKLKGDPGRRDAVLHTALQVVQDANTLLTPFLPHSAQKVHEALGGTGVWASQPDLLDVADLDLPGRTNAVLTGDHGREQARWASTPIPVGRPLARPTPIFTKPAPELAETGPEWAPHHPLPPPPPGPPPAARPPPPATNGTFVRTGRTNVPFVGGGGQ